MEFMTEAQKACYEKVRPWMQEIFGEFVYAREDVPAFVVPMGSALAQLSIYPWGDDDAVVCVRAYVVCNLEMTPDLMRYLLQRNDSMRFGAFGMDDEEDIFFEHSIVGSTCDKNELRASVLAVLSTADNLDDEIVSRWGGERALDRMR